MKIAASPYLLEPSGPPPGPPHRLPRQGALLRVAFPDGSTGYADCHPWPELGDAPVEQQLALLSKGESTALTRRTLHFARMDAYARNEGRSLFDGLGMPKSHWLVPKIDSLDQALIESLLLNGFDTLKIKCGADYRETVKKLEELFMSSSLSSFRLRFDCNERLDAKQFEDFITLTSSWHDRVDFIEDPVPYDPDLWRGWRERYGIRLACDRQALAALRFPASCDYLVVKPAIESVEPFLAPERGTRPLVITSYLDHPIGLLGAAYAAAKAYSAHPEALSQCGLLTHHCYRATPFCDGMRKLSPYLALQDSGPGWGYFQQLSAMYWEPLA